VSEDVHRADKYKLKPTPDQERQLEEIVWRCRALYNTALEERFTAFRCCGVTLTCSRQQAELPELKAAFPEYAASYLSTGLKAPALRQGDERPVARRRHTPTS
jgi:hypothetical protein